MDPLYYDKGPHIEVIEMPENRRRVLIDGKECTGVTRATIDMQPGEIAKVHFTVMPNKIKFTPGFTAQTKGQV